MTKIDKTIKAMQEYIKELENVLSEQFDKLTSEENIAKAREVVDNTTAVINNCIEKVKAQKDEIKNDEKLEEFLDKIIAKTKEAVEIGKEKIQTITAKKATNTIDDLTDSIMEEFDKLKESEIGKKTKVLIKDIDNKINEFFTKPEVKQAISKAKTTTVSIAQKGVDGLKKILDVEENKEETSNDEDKKYN